MNSESPRNTFSTLTGITMLVLLLAFFTDRLVFSIPLRLGSFSIVLLLKTIDLVTPAIAIVVALALYDLTNRTGTSTFPERFVHTFLPFASILATGVSLRNAGGGLAWWLLFIFGGLLLFFVLMSEYIVCDPNEERLPLALIMLTGLCYAVFIVAAVAIRSNVTRLALELPLIMLISFVITVRIFYFWLVRQNIGFHATVISIVMLALAAGLHYWPLNAIAYGLLLFIWYYIVVNVEILLSQGCNIRESIQRQLPLVLVLVAALAYVEFLLM